MVKNRDLSLKKKAKTDILLAATGVAEFSETPVS
jgi:hypothetical protein